MYIVFENWILPWGQGANGGFPKTSGVEVDLAHPGALLRDMSELYLLCSTAAIVNWLDPVEIGALVIQNHLTSTDGKAG
jgi:hypothetical protein